MKKNKKKKFFLALSTGIFLLFITLSYWLETKGWIKFPEIEQVRLYFEKDFAFGAPEFFKLPRTYSRFWDLFFLPIFIAALIWSGKKSKQKANPWFLAGEMTGILIFAHYLASGVLALYAGLLFAGVCGLVFDEFTGIFLAFVFGLIVGLAGFGLLFGLLFTAGAYLVYLVLKFFII